MGDGGKRFSYIDFGKGFAIFFIVVYHYVQPFVSGLGAKAVMVGGTGVHLFILISGFGLALSTKGRHAHALSFYRRRIATVLLPYYAVIIASFLLNQYIPYFQGADVYALGGHILLYKMFDERIVGSFGPPFWFMSTIIQFYIAYPFLQRWMDAVSAKWFLGGSLLLSGTYWCAITAFEVADLRVFNSFFLQFLWEFCLGMCLARHSVKGGRRFWELPPLTLLAVALLGIGSMGILATAGGIAGRVFDDIPASLGYVALSALCFQLSERMLPWLNTAFVRLGPFSYQLYLLHSLTYAIIMPWATRLNPGGPGIAHSVLIALPLALLAAYLYAKVPFNRIGNKLIPAFADP